MPALDRNEKVKYEDCGIQEYKYEEYRRSDAARHQKRCAKGVVSCPDCKYSTYNQQEMSYHMAKKHAQPSSKQSTVRSSCEQDFPSYYSLQQHRRKEHGAKQRKPSDTVADLNKIVEEEGEDGEKLKEELGACQHFLVDTEMENVRNKVFNFQMSGILKSLTRNLKKSSTSSILQPKSTLLWVLFFEILRLVNILFLRS